MTTVLTVDSLRKRFGGVTAVDGLSFDLPAGQICGLIGPNGSGKSTTLHLLSGFIRPNGGSIALFEQRADRLSVQQRAGLGMGRTFQSPKIFQELTVLENVLTGCHSITMAGRRLFDVVFRPGLCRRTDMELRDRSMGALERAGLAEHAGRLAKDLAYGEQKLLDLARALVFEPKLLLLDEPAAGLSRDLVDRLTGILQHLKGSGTTVLFAEHNMKLVMGLCDRIVVLNFGQLIADGTPETIRSNPEVIRAYLGQSYAA